MKNVQNISELKKKRLDAGLTQKEAAEKTGVSLRSYVSYENDSLKAETVKYRYLLRELNEAYLYDENHGILSRDVIIKGCKEVFANYDVEFCYLFGSYAKGNPSETSDIDLLVCGKFSGIKFYELVERLRERFNKQIDLLDIKQIVNNEDMLREVLKYGVKIYEQQE